MENDTYYSNLLKIWDLDATDNKVLLTHFPRTQGPQARTHRSRAHEKRLALSDSAGIEGYSSLYDRGLLPGDVLPGDGRSVRWHSLSPKIHLMEDICSNCSHRNSSDSNWCIECGKALILPKYTEISHQEERDSAISRISHTLSTNSLTDDNLSANELIECFGNLRHSPNCSLGGHTNSCCTVTEQNKEEREVNHSTPSSPVEETETEPSIHLQSYERRWKTSSAYMWRKPSTLDSQLSPTVTPPASAWMSQDFPKATDNVVTVRRKHPLVSHLDLSKLNCSLSVEESPLARSTTKVMSIL